MNTNNMQTQQGDSIGYGKKSRNSPEDMEKPQPLSNHRKVQTFQTFFFLTTINPKKNFQ